MPSADYEGSLIDERVENYAASLDLRDPTLLDLEKDAERRSLSTIGPIVGRLISMILKSAKAKRALEVGTSTGYSGIWIARSLQGDQKKLTTIELDPKKCKEAQANFRKAAVDKCVEVMCGDARTLVPEIANKNPGGFDLVFLDFGNKSAYVDLLNCFVDALRVGGFLIADNTVFGGSIVSPEDKSPNARAIRRFNELVFSDKRLDAAIIPLRTKDSPPYGFTVAYKNEV